MMKSTIFLAACLLGGAAIAQEGPRGHWTGSIQLPDRELAVEVDLDKKAAGWVGSIAIPAQNAAGLPLEEITVGDGKCGFRIKGAPGQPTFNGTLAADGKTLGGDFTQGPGSFPFKLTRAGDPKVAEAKPSPAVAKEFVGNWEGTLEAGQSLRLVLKMSNDSTGANATMVSVDQGGAEIPVSAVEQTGTKLKLTVQAVGGAYDAEINKDGTELSGNWSQSGMTFPLKLTKKVEKTATPAKP